MSTSGSYDNSLNLTEIIRDAFSLINVHDDGEQLPAEMYTYGRRQLNLLVNFLSIHRGLWLDQEVEVTLTPGTESYTVGVGETIDTPKPMEIIDARRTGTNDIPIRVYSRNEYIRVPNKSMQAAPAGVYYHPQRDAGVLYVWPTGTSTDNTLKITMQRPIQDFDLSTNNPDIPKEWWLLIVYMLATYIAPKYLGGVVPPDIKIQADQMLASLVGFDEEKTSVFIQPA